MVIQLQTVVIMMTILAFIPFDWILPISINGIAYSAAIWVAILSSTVTIITNNKMPPVAEGWQACQPYIAKVSQSTEFHFLFYSLIFVNATQPVFILLVPGRRALWSVLTHAARSSAGVPQWEEKIKPQWEMMKKSEPQILLYSALFEVLIGFYLIFSMVFNMQILTLVLYWSFLRIRFHAARSRAVHSSAWDEIGKKVNPILDKAPPVKGAVEKLKDYFQKPM